MRSTSVSGKPATGWTSVPASGKDPDGHEVARGVARGVPQGPLRGAVGAVREEPREEKPIGAGETATHVSSGYPELRPWVDQASELIDELAEVVLAIYLHRSSMGGASRRASGPAQGSGNAVLSLYLEAQDLLPAEPETALHKAREGLRLARALLGELRRVAHAAHAGGRLTVADAPKVPETMTDGDARLLAGEAHDLLERLHDFGARPKVGPYGTLDLALPVDGPNGGPDGVSAPGSSSALEAATVGLRDELARLLIWDSAEAGALLTESHRYVAERWLPGVREPEDGPRLWAAGLEAAARRDMGRFRVLLRKWVRAYGEEIRRHDRRSRARRPADRPTGYEPLSQRRFIPEDLEIDVTPDGRRGVS